MTVKILTTDPAGNHYDRGILFLDNRQVVAWPKDSPILQHLVKETILIDEDSRPRVIDPQDTPMNILKTCTGIMPAQHCGPREPPHKTGFERSSA